MSTTEKRPGRSSSREKLLDAAADLVRLHGVQNLTIEAVAAAAQVTKSGLIYHFKTREDLLAALVDRLVAEYEDQTVQLETLGATGASLEEPLRCHIDTTLDMPESKRQLLVGLLTAGIAHPELKGPVRALYARGYGSLQISGAQAGRALMINAALDGALLLDLLDLHHMTAEQREALRAALLDVARNMSIDAGRAAI